MACKRKMRDIARGSGSRCGLSLNLKQLGSTRLVIRSVRFFIDSEEVFAYDQILHEFQPRAASGRKAVL